MAVPRLAEARPFYCLDPRALDLDPEAAGERETAARIAPMVSVDAMRPVDFIVCGSVAVHQSGARIGKGAGFSDIEMALLAEAGLLSDHTTIATTVHELQVLDDDLPEEGYDFRVDLIITPERAIRCETAKRPAGLDWNSLTPEQIASIPVLKNERRLSIATRGGSGATPTCGVGSRTWPRCLNGAAPEGAERRRVRGVARGVRLYASMEPLPKERSDWWDEHPRLTYSQWPQWSRLRRSGATRHLPRPPHLRPRASMEPLPKERSDEAGGEAFVVGHAASMEPLPKERSDGWRGCTDRRILRASMEPLPKERSDVPRLLGAVQVVLPQWSRSRRSGATFRASRCGPRRCCLNGAAPEGAERRNGAAAWIAWARRPQWSRSRRSGATDAGPSA